MIRFCLDPDATEHSAKLDQAFDDEGVQNLYIPNPGVGAKSHDIITIYLHLGRLLTDRDLHVSWTLHIPAYLVPKRQSNSLRLGSDSDVAGDRPVFSLFQTTIGKSVLAEERFGSEVGAKEVAVAR